MKKSLFFPAASVLAKLDAYEGWFNADPDTLPELNRQTIAQAAAYMKISYDEAHEKIQKVSAEGWRHIIEYFPEDVFINCWHMNDDESDAMWKIYAKDRGYGVAICTTLERLKASFSTCNYPVYIGAVNYMDYNRYLVNPENNFNRFMHKRLAFRHEEELRVVRTCPEMFPHAVRSADVTQEEVLRAENVRKQIYEDQGMYVPVQLEDLIIKIVVSPEAQPWFVDVVKAVLRAFTVDVKVENSKMQQPPSVIKR